jgi:transcriptional regulator with XRE-family HTH domain
MRSAEARMSSQVSQNVRYLLWRKQVPREEWRSWLVNHTSLDQTAAGNLVGGALADDRITPDQLRDLARAFELEHEGEILRFGDLVREGANILQENLRFLLDSLGFGGKKVLAAELGIDPTTVSRWLNGTYEPQPPTLRQLVSRFGLPPETDLRRDPIFLSAEPISHLERRRWLQRRIDGLTPTEFRDLYPALRRMLEDR